jgi:cobalt-zinc-cadmium efflux system membrane fusion protein
VLFGCGSSGSSDPRTSIDTVAPAGGERAKGGEEEHSDEIRMTPAMIKDAGITVEPIRKEPISTTLRAPGRVLPTQNGIAHVGTIIPGRIARLLVSEGSAVVIGTPLAEIEAFDIGQLKGELMTARANVEQTGSALARQEKLATEAIGATRTLEEARSANAQATSSLRAVEAKLRAAGINPSAVAGGAYSSRLVLRSPISGIVARRRVALGEYLEPNKDAFEVVNTSTVWIDAEIGPEIAATLQIGGAGFIRDQGDRRHTGRITFISPTVDPETRTVTVRIELSNPNRYLRPESFVTVEFERQVSGYALALPREAIEQEGSSYYVYREQEPDVFVRVPVEPGSQSGERQVIAAGLDEGDRIAVSGLFYLKSARQKGELQEHDD